MFFTLGCFTIKLYHPLLIWYRALIVDSDKKITHLSLFAIEALFLIHIISLQLLKKRFKSKTYTIIIVTDSLLCIVAMISFFVSYVLGHMFDKSTFNPS